MTKNTMSWIVVMLLVFIIILLAVCIYLDIEFTSAFAPSTEAVTSPVGTTTEPIINTISPIVTTSAFLTTKAPASSATPQTTKTPVASSSAPKVTETPTTTTAAPVVTTTPQTTQAPPQTTQPTVFPDAPTICIDPGHGFSDPGAIRTHSETGVTYNENEINLAIALKLKEELLALGYNVIMTHDGVNLPEEKYLTKSGNDTFFYVNERNQWIKDHNDEIDLVISIHCDVADPSVSGTRFYILSTKMTGFTAKSVPLAEALCLATHDAFGTTPPKNKYNTQELAVLKTGIPSVLVESAFMSNTSDLNKLIDPAWQTTFAKALAQGVKNYLAI